MIRQIPILIIKPIAKLERKKIGSSGWIALELKLVWLRVKESNGRMV